jgi:hypothetical protein
MTLTPKHRLILGRLIGTRTPVAPEQDEYPLFEELFNEGYLNYTYGAHSQGFTITCLGMDEITVHRQRDKL